MFGNVPEFVKSISGVNSGDIFSTNQKSVFYIEKDRMAIDHLVTMVTVT